MADTDEKKWTKQATEKLFAALNRADEIGGEVRDFLQDTVATDPRYVSARKRIAKLLGGRYVSREEEAAKAGGEGEADGRRGGDGERDREEGGRRASAIRRSRRRSSASGAVRGPDGRSRCSSATRWTSTTSTSRSRSTRRS